MALSQSRKLCETVQLSNVHWNTIHVLSWGTEVQNGGMKSGVPYDMVTAP